MTPKWQKLASLPRKYAHSGFSSLVQSLLPKDTILRTYLIAKISCRSDVLIINGPAHGILVLKVSHLTTDCFDDRLPVSTADANKFGRERVGEDFFVC